MSATSTFVWGFLQGDGVPPRSLPASLALRVYVIGHDSPKLARPTSAHFGGSVLVGIMKHRGLDAMVNASVLSIDGTLTDAVLSCSARGDLPGLEFLFNNAGDLMAPPEVELGINYPAEAIRTAAARRCYLSGQHIERALGDRDRRVRKALAGNMLTTLSEDVIRKGLVDHQPSVRLAFAERVLAAIPDRAYLVRPCRDDRFTVTPMDRVLGCYDPDPDVSALWHRYSDSGTVRQTVDDPGFVRYALDTALKELVGPDQRRRLLDAASKGAPSDVVAKLYAIVRSLPPTFTVEHCPNEPTAALRYTNGSQSYYVIEADSESLDLVYGSIVEGLNNPPRVCEYFDLNAAIARGASLDLGFKPRFLTSLCLKTPSETTSPATSLDDAASVEDDGISM